MYEIDLSTNLLIGLSEEKTKVVTYNDSFIVNYSVKEIINHSCKYFGSSLIDRTKFTKRFIKITSKVPILIEDSRNILFFPLKSSREKVNIWISYNNLEKYEKNGNNTILYFKDGKKEILTFSYYIIDNQVTRSMMLDYEIRKRRESLKK